MEHILQAPRGKGYATDGAQFPISRPDRATVPLVTRTGMPVVGKLYPLGQGERIYVNMQELWHSSFGEGRRPPGLPRPLDYLPDIGVLIMERIAGRPLAEFGTPDKDSLSAAVRLVASLHESQTRPGRRRDARRLVRALRQKVESTPQLAPAYASALWAGVEALKRYRSRIWRLPPATGISRPATCWWGRIGS